jgi:hypothetical protein
MLGVCAQLEICRSASGGSRQRHDTGIEGEILSRRQVAAGGVELCDECFAFV